MSVRLGLKGKIYRNSGPFGAPTWEEIDNTKDVTLALEVGEADATTRKNNGWKATVPTLKDGSVDGQMVWNPGDPHFEALRDAYLNGTAIDMAIMDGDITVSGNQGLRADFAVLKFTRNEPLEEVMTVDFTIKPTFSDNAPQWLEI